GVRRHVRRGRRRVPAHERGLCPGRCDPPAGVHLRRRAPALLGRAQERVSCRRPGLARLLLHGRHDSAPPPGPRAERHHRHGRRVRVALRQRLPCGRRQPAPPHSVRCQRAGRDRACRTVRCRHSRTLCRGGRYGHRRTRRGRRKDQSDVRAVLAPGARFLPGVQARLRPLWPAESREGDSHAVALCRIRPHACSCRRAALPGHSPFLRFWMDFVLSEMIDKVMTARASQRPLYLQGGGTKRFYGEVTPPVSNGSQLDLSPYSGVINYQPSELVITAKAGTPLHEIEALLASNRQMLAFEPPRFGPESTIGGCVASGLSGPRRMQAGALRDFVLGATLLDASGTLLRFGGEVMKNVAGYDISRLLAGSMGIFGPMLEVSIKVAPIPLGEETLVLELTEVEALQRFNTWRSKPLPISATCWQLEGNAGVLRVRISGSDPALESARRAVGGQRLGEDQAAAYWDSLRDQTHPWFQKRPLWRVAVPPTTPA